MKKTILIATLIATIIACNSKQAVSPVSDSQSSDLSALTPTVTIDKDNLCWNGSTYSVAVRFQHTIPSDSMFAFYSFQKQHLDSLYWPGGKGTYHFPLQTLESGCGGKIIAAVVRNGITYADTVKGNCKPCNETAPSRPLGTFSCACTDTTKHTYHLWIQLDQVVASDIVQVRILGNDSTLINSVTLQPINGFQNGKVKYNVDGHNCGEGILSLVVIRDGVTWKISQWTNPACDHYCNEAGGSDCPGSE